MLNWLADRKNCLLKSENFEEFVEANKGDLSRFYLLGNTKLYEDESMNKSDLKTNKTHDHFRVSICIFFKY